MNRFEALHTLGLEESASDEDVRLAYYGIERSVDPNEYADVEAIRRSAQGLRDRAKQARDFLLDARSKKSAAQQVLERATGRRKEKKLSITAEQDKTARLNGLEKVRMVVVGHLDSQRTARNTSIGVIAACIVASFVVLRYVRAMYPRVMVTIIIAVAAVIASTVLTTSMMAVRKSKNHVIELDGRIEKLKRQLGLIDDEEDAAGEAVEPADVADADEDVAALPSPQEDEEDSARSDEA